MELSTGRVPEAVRIFVETAAKAAEKMGLRFDAAVKHLRQLWLEFMDREGWRAAQIGVKSSGPRGRVPWQVARNRIERAERQFTCLWQKSAACCQDLAEREEASPAPQVVPATETGLSTPSDQVLSIGSVPSRRSCGTPSVDLQRAFSSDRNSHWWTRW